MALPASTRPDVRQAETEILGNLLRLYEEQRQIYRRVLELSRQQGEVLRQGGSLASVSLLLQQKKGCLETIRRLEQSERRNKQDWEKGRTHWSAAGKARLHASLHEVGTLIEDILQCEERNDLILIEQAKEF